MEREAFESMVRNAPRRVTWVVTLSLLLGLLVAARMMTFHFAGTLPLGNALFYSLLSFAVLFGNGLSIPARSRFGYVLLVVFAVLPSLGILGGTLHLLRLLVGGDWANDRIGMIIGVISTFQLVVIILLFINLFSRDVRQYVWRRQSEPAA